MNASQYRLLTLALAWGAMVDGFISTRSRPLPVPTRNIPRQRQQAHVDPNAVVQHVNDLAAAPQLLHHPDLQSLLSTMYTTGVAHGHSDPWFGPPDPYLTAGKSIVPATSADAASLTSTTDSLPKIAQYFSSKGWNVLDSSIISPEKDLPGFKATGGILPAREKLPPTDNVEVFSAQVEWAANYMNVALKLPLAAFFYVLVEFFFLRSNVDTFKSEIEQESQTALWADTLATVFVRMIAMSVVAIFTLTLFG